MVNPQKCMNPPTLTRERTTMRRTRREEIKLPMNKVVDTKMENMARPRFT
jgi:hypothetical protein